MKIKQIIALGIGMMMTAGFCVPAFADLTQPQKVALGVNITEDVSGINIDDDRNKEIWNIEFTASALTWNVVKTFTGGKKKITWNPDTRKYSETWETQPTVTYVLDEGEEGTKQLTITNNSNFSISSKPVLSGYYSMCPEDISTTGFSFEQTLALTQEEYQKVLSITLNPYQLGDFESIQTGDYEDHQTANSIGEITFNWQKVGSTYA